MPPPLFFGSFGSGVFLPALRRIAGQASEMELFQDVFAFETHDLDAEWRAQHGTFMDACPRGHGYYLWKPQAVVQMLERMPEGAVLVYADAGCDLVKEGRPRLLEYVAMVAAHPSAVLAFALDHPECAWTKMDVLRALEFDGPEQLHTPQHASGIFLIHNVAAGRDFARTWRDIVTCDYRFVADYPSGVPNHPSFREHRHDQSVYSILVKKRQCVSIPDETWWAPDWDGHRQYPIHARRRRD